jgi:hypothetical protein
MTQQAIKLKIIEQAEVMAKEIAKGKDLYITKNGTDIVIKKMSVQKV